MKTFIFKARSGDSRVLDGTVNAASERLAVEKLLEKGYHPFSLEERGCAKTGQRPILFRPPRSREVADLTSNLSELLNAGLTLFDSLSIIERQVGRSVIRGVVRDIKEKIKEGSSFADALSSHPAIFPAVYINIVRAGELSGMLPESMNQLTLFLERQADVRARIFNALVYPLFMISTACLTLFVVMAFVIPRLSTVFFETGEDLPRATRLLVGAGYFAHNYWHLIVSFMILCVISVRYLRALPRLKRLLDRLSLKMPVISSLVVSIELEKFFRALSMLLKRNISLPYAVEASAATVDNYVLRDKLRRSQRDILSGTSFSLALKKAGLVREDIMAIINTGEESGGLHRLLLRIADRKAYGNEMIIKRLLLMLEPAVIFTVGLVIGYIVIAMLLPVFQISSIIR